jgi:hypothetical protein
MNDWWMPVLLIAVLLWLTRHKWKTWFSSMDFGDPPHQPGERFQDYDAARKRREERDEVDRILEKIAASGMSSLSAKEKSLLEQASKRENRNS